jgi:hypothetical protein
MAKGSYLGTIADRARAPALALAPPRQVGRGRAPEADLAPAPARPSAQVSRPAVAPAINHGVLQPAPAPVRPALSPLSAPSPEVQPARELIAAPRVDEPGRGLVPQAPPEPIAARALEPVALPAPAAPVTLPAPAAQGVRGAPRRAAVEMRPVRREPVREAAPAPRPEPRPRRYVAPPTPDRMPGLASALHAAFQWVTSPDAAPPRAAAATAEPAPLLPRLALPALEVVAPAPPALEAVAPAPRLAPSAAERRDVPAQARALEPVPLPREPRAPEVQAPRSIHIGAIEVQIQPAAVPPRIQPREAPRPAAAPLPLSREFMSTIGFRQG